MALTAAIQRGARRAVVGVLAGLAAGTIAGVAPAAEGETDGRNVILFVGDGMGVTTVTATRILAGQEKGMPGEGNVLPWETFPHLALMKTYNTNQQVADSAGAGTALLTGEKTKAGVIGVARDIIRGDCESMAGHRLSTLLERAERAGRATGIVTTARLTHATPAAAYAHSPERYWESDADMPEAARKAGCADIAGQFVSFDAGDGIEVAFGGGRAKFLPAQTADPEYPDETGERADGRDLIRAWRSRTGGSFVWDQFGFEAYDPDTPGSVLGLFQPSHMQYSVDRDRDAMGEPSLAAMTAKAIEKLRNDENGYFLLVEGARIDHAHHGNDAARALYDGIALAKAVKRADEMTDDAETLIIVTADHSHTFNLAGYPTRGNPILGPVIGNDRQGAPEEKPATATDGKPYTTLGYYGGLKAWNGKERPDPIKNGAGKPGYQYQAAVPTRGGTHGGEDVPAYAKGPGADGVAGVMEQNLLFDVMAGTLGLLKTGTDAE